MQHLRSSSTSAREGRMWFAVFRSPRFRDVCAHLNNFVRTARNDKLFPLYTCCHFSLRFWLSTVEYWFLTWIKAGAEMPSHSYRPPALWALWRQRLPPPLFPTHSTSLEPVCSHFALLHCLVCHLYRILTLSFEVCLSSRSKLLVIDIDFPHGRWS